MLSGNIVRKRKNEKRYKQFTDQKKGAGCDFCAFTSASEQTVKEFSHFWAVKNLFGYDLWDGLNVLDHLLVVPKRHVDSIAHFKPAESAEFMAILSEYEQSGYSVYARSPHSVAKTVAHQHTHLIKLGTKITRGLLYVRKPHVLKYL